MDRKPPLPPPPWRRMTPLEKAATLAAIWGDRPIPPDAWREAEIGGKTRVALAAAEAGLRYWRRQVRVYVRAWRDLGPEPAPEWRAHYRRRLAESWRRYRFCQTAIRTLETAIREADALAEPPIATLAAAPAADRHEQLVGLEIEHGMVENDP